MKLSEEDRKAIVENRITKAFDTWQETETIIRENFGMPQQTAYITPATI